MSSIVIRAICVDGVKNGVETDTDCRGVYLLLRCATGPGETVARGQFPDLTLAVADLIPM